MDINFNTDNFSNATLAKFSAFAVREGGDNHAITGELEDSRVQFRKSGELEHTGLNRWRGRTTTDEENNNHVRTELVRALKDELGINDATESATLKTLAKILGKDIFKPGDYGKGRPLTMRRITNVLNQVAIVKAQRAAEALAALKMQLAEEVLTIEHGISKLTKSLVALAGGVDAETKKAFGELLARVCSGEAGKVDLEAFAFRQLSRGGTRVTKNQVAAFVEKFRAGITDQASFDTLLAKLNQVAGGSLAKHVQAFQTGAIWKYGEAEPKIAEIKAKAPGLSDEECAQFAYASAVIDSELEFIDDTDKRAYTAARLREFGVSNEVAKQVWNVDDLNVLEAKGGNEVALETLKTGTIDEKIGAMKSILDHYESEFTNSYGNANNQLWSGATTGNKFKTISRTFNLLKRVLHHHDEIKSLLEKAAEEAHGGRHIPCSETDSGRAAIELIERLMEAGAHGTSNNPETLAFAIDRFATMPELLAEAMEKDIAQGTGDKWVREFFDAVNTDGCVQARSEALNAFSDKLTGISDQLDLGRKDSKIDVLAGKAFKFCFPAVDDDNPINFDSFATRFAKFLAKRGYGTYEDRLAEINANKNTLLMAFEFNGLRDNATLKREDFLDLCFKDAGTEKPGVAFMTSTTNFRDLATDTKLVPNRDTMHEAIMNPAAPIGKSTYTYLYVLDTRKLAGGKAAVMGYMRIPKDTAHINKADEGKSIEETRIAKLMKRLEKHPEIIEINPDYVG